MMSRMFVSSCLLLASVAIAEEAVAWEGEAGNVKFVGDDSFEQYRADTPQFLAFFFAPWCGHCKAAKPEFAKASEQSTIPMVAVDCTSTGKGTCSGFGISGYPTIQFFDASKDEPVDYDGGRTAKGFLKYLLKLDPDYVPAPFENTSPEEWEDSGRIVHMTDDHFVEYRAKHPRFLAFFYAPWCGHCKTAKPDFAAASTRFHQRTMPFLAFDCTGEGSATCGENEVKSFPQFKFFDGEKDPEAVFQTQERSSGDFINFVEKRLEAASGVEEGQELTKADLKKMRVRALRKMLKNKGAKCNGCTEKSHFVDRVLETMSMPDIKDAPKKVVKHKKTLMQEKREKVARATAAKGWSEEAHGDGEVVHAYDLEVFDAHLAKIKPEQGALGFFFAPWCGHCKTSKPHFVAASVALKDMAKDMELGAAPMIAVDCDVAIDVCSKHGVKSFPTLIWFGANEQVEKIDGGSRNEEQYIKTVMTRLDSDWTAAPAGPFVNTPKWDDDSGNVVFMDDGHFADFRKETPKFLSFFYAPWCGHCKAAKPEYAAASESDEIGDISMVAMDCTSDGSDTCSKFGVKGYPTIKFFDGDDEPTDYSGARNQDGFVEFLAAQNEEI